MAEQSIPRYPLEWPSGWKRTPEFRRQRATFKRYGQWISMAQASERLEGELRRLGAKGATLSSNVSLRLDGRPRSDESPKDSGVAVYFQFKGRATVLACDRYQRVGDNVAAIAAHIEALRKIERLGVGTIEQALAGYKALPADTAADWRSVFGFGRDERVTVDALNTKYHERARSAHPDRGGTDEAMAHINRARDYALQELEGQ